MMYYAIKMVAVLDVALLAIIMGNLFMGKRAKRVPPDARIFFITSFGSWGLWTGQVFFMVSPDYQSQILLTYLLGMASSTLTHASVIYFHKHPKMRLWTNDPDSNSKGI